MTIPTLEQCHVTAGKLIEIQSARLVALAEVRRLVTEAVDEKRQATDAERIAAVRAALKVHP